jgi:putative ABC transport system permease protein
MLPEYLAIAMQTLRANPLRTLLSTLGVIIGVGALVSILSLVDGMEAFARADLEATTDLQIITVNSVTTDRVDGVVLRRRGWPVFTPTDAAELAAALRTPAQVGLMTQYAAFWEVPGDTAEMAAMVTALTPATQALRPPVVLAGRVIEAADLEPGAARVAVIAAGAARRIAGSSGSGSGIDGSGSGGGSSGGGGDHGAAAAHAAIGRTIVISGVPHEVVGVTDAPATERITRISIPLLPPESLPGLADGRPPQLVVRAVRVEEVPAARDETESWLAATRDTAGGVFAVSSNVGRVAQAARAMMVFRLVMGAIAGISLVVGGIGIMNVLLASVTERTREIGIRRASGARRRDIRRQFLAESVAISAVGSGLGAILGIVVSTVALHMVGEMADAPLSAVFTWQSLGFAMGAALVVGLVFGTYPALRAGRLSPIEALRHE